MSASTETQTDTVHAPPTATSNNNDYEAKLQALRRQTHLLIRSLRVKNAADASLEAAEKEQEERKYLENIKKTLTARTDTTRTRDGFDTADSGVLVDSVEGTRNTQQSTQNTQSPTKHHKKIQASPSKFPTKTTQSIESPSRTRRKSPTRTAPRSPWSRSYSRSPSPSRTKHINPLDRGNEFFDELQNFRRKFPEEFFRKDDTIPQPTSNLLQTLNTTRVPPPKQTSPTSQYYYSGYFTVNERLFPERARHPFVFRDRNLREFTPHEGNDWEEDYSGVKVSLPHSRVFPDVKTYKPKTRREYDPGNSISIGDYLRRGYEMRGRVKELDNVSLRHEPKKKQKKDTAEEELVDV